MRKVFDNNCQQSMQGLSSMDWDMEIDSIFPSNKQKNHKVDQVRTFYVTHTHVTSHLSSSPCHSGSRNIICILLICHSDCAPENQLKCQHSKKEWANRFIPSKVDNSHSIHVFNWLNIRATAAALFWLLLKWNINRISYFTTSFEESGPFCLFQYLMLEDFEYYCWEIWCWVLITLQYTGRHE